MRALRLAVFLLIAASLAAHGAIPTAEREALVAFYQATGGPSWSDSTRWLGAAGTECSWFGVTCDSEETTVLELVLPANNLVGTLPSKLGALTHLTYLNLAENALAGAIPAALGQLTALREIRLDRNRLTSLPDSIAGLVNLKTLNVAANEIDGTIPDALFSLVGLEELSLHINSFSGPVPPELRRMISLRELDLAENELSGFIPGALGEMVQLERLDLSDNALEGSIPAALGNLTNLWRLGLASNRLTGSIPPELYRLTALEDLWLYANELSGPIPDGIGALSSLRALGLEDNALSGPIPKELGSLAALESMYLGDNRLSGEIPVELASLVHLENLDLSGNLLTGSIPAALGDLASLKGLSLYGNTLTGEIPSEIGRLTALERLYLSGNRLEGAIPERLGSLGSLTDLNLGDNLLTGSIPDTFGQLTALRELVLGWNRLSGEIPRSIGNLTKLEILDLAGNALEGPIPVEVGTLTLLTELRLGENRLTGSIPESIGDLVALTHLVLGGNRLSGPLPASLTRLTALENLDLAENRLTGSIPADIGALANLRSLELQLNFFEGTIPPSLWTLAALEELILFKLDLSGTLPPEIRSLKNLEDLRLDELNLSGTIPPEIGEMTALRYLALDENRLTGTIPREIGNLSNLVSLDLSSNALTGPVPAEIKQLTSLEAEESDFGYNALYTKDASVEAFLDSHEEDGDFSDTQTTTPTGLRIVSTTDRSMVVEWTLIEYIDDDGGYRLTATPQGGGSPIVTVTASKEIGSAILRGLKPSTRYSVTVAALSYPAGWQKNLIASAESAPVTGTTKAPATAPPDVGVTAWTNGLIQIDGVAANEDSFTLANFGDAATTVTLRTWSGDGNFFSIDPASFTLAGLSSRTVKVSSIPSPVGSYWGDVCASGTGVPDDLCVPVTLLSVSRPAGTVVAEAVEARVEISGDPGTKSIGTARFRNTGTATLSGVVVSNVPWLLPPAAQITIDPGETAAVNFTVDRSLRPAGTGEGALSGILTLVYVGGSASGNAALKQAQNGTTGVSRTLVTVVDVAKQKVTASGIPALGTGEIALFAPGVASRPGTATNLVSDLGIANAYGTRAVTDLKVYYTPVGSTRVSVASLEAIATDSAVTLANLIANVYGVAGSESGTLQLRSGALGSLVVSGRLLNFTSAGGGTIGEIPILRSDRAARPGETIVLTGVAKSAILSTDLYVQETIGVAAAARIQMLDAAGATVGTAREVALEAFGTAELSDVAGEGAVTAIVTHIGTGGQIAAYARVSDSVSGDRWAVTDWGRGPQRVVRTATLLVPQVGSTQAGSSRRRLVGRGSTGGAAAADAATTSMATELWLHNPAETDALIELALIASSGTRRAIEVELGAGETMNYADVVRTIAGGPASGSLKITPLRGSVAATARLRIGDSCGTCGAALPVMTSGSGLRAGQTQRFSGLDGASARTVAARTPGTFRSGFGVIETSGSPVKVRATLKLASGRSPIATVLTRLVALEGGGAIAFDDLATALFGEARGDADLHDLQVDFEVEEGDGSAVVWVVSTDNATGDAIVRVE